MKASSDSPPRQGSALVITLCILVLITAIVTAFFAQSLLTRQISFSSAGQERARLVALTALDEVQAAMNAEMQAGSNVYPVPTPAPGNTTPIVMRPRSATTMIPYHMIPATDTTNRTLAPNLVKFSYNNASTSPSAALWPSTSFFYKGTTLSNAPMPATSVLTTTPSSNGRYIDATRWAKPALNATDSSHTPTYPSAYIPYWVLMGRSGVVPPTTAVSTMDNNAATNASYVIGRFAYTVYDEGGLLDITAAGYPSSVTTSSATATANKGSQGYADLTQLGLSATQSDTLVKWRNLANATSSTSYLNFLTNFAPQYGFMRAAPGDNAFVSRQDFLRFWQKNVATTSNASTDPSNDYLQYFTTFSREKNAPSWGPYLDASSMPGGSNDGIYTNVASYAQTYSSEYAYTTNDQAYLAGTATPGSSSLPDINRLFPGVRVTTAFTRLNGETAVVGEPLVKNRFDLSKLAWISHNSSSLPSGVTAADIYKYFGLKPTNAAGAMPPDTWSWTYNHGNSTADPIHIMTLDEVAKAGREPDFFELLQAGILQGSLGVCDGAPNTAAASNTGEFNRYKNLLGQGTPILRSDATPGNLVVAQESYQIIQIGANIIDQANTDGFPREIVLNGEHFYGVDNLPYVQSVADTTMRPSPNAALTTATTPALPHVDFQAYVYHWITFALWNPHQNASAPASGSPAKIRLYAVSGKMQPGYLGGIPKNYNSAPLPNPTSYGPGFNGAAWTATAPCWISLNIADYANRFSEPTLLDPDLTSVTPDGTQTTQNTDQQNYGKIKSQFSGKAAWSRAGFYVGYSYAPESPSLVSLCGPLKAVGQTPTTNGTSTGPDDVTIYSESLTVSVNPTVYLQYLDPATSTWHTYQEMRNLYYTHNAGDAPYMEAGDTEWGSTYWASYLPTHQPGPQNGNHFPAADDESSWPTNAIDPRSQRFNLRCPVNRSMTKTFADTNPGRVDAVQFSNPNFKSNGGGATWTQFAAEFVNNVSSNANIVYTDRDGIMRPGDGDGWAGADPQPQLTAATALPAANPRPIMLNRPFHSVGELGFVSRDTPWKTLDLFSSVSADSALLDIFCVGPTTPTIPTNLPPPSVVAGKLNINSSNATVLQALVANAARTYTTASPLTVNTTMTATDAKAVATAIATSIKSTPLRNLGELPSSMPAPATTGAPAPIITGFPGNKIQREAAIRALADGSGTRTWNLLIDVIAQSGRYRSGATKLDTDFIVEGEKRYWLHVAIDRFTGEVVDKQLEPVSEQ